MISRERKIAGIALLTGILTFGLFTDGRSADYSFTVEVRDPIVIAPMGEITILKATITNTGDLLDTLDVTMEFEAPDTSWFVLLCVGPICYPPGVTSAPLGLGPGQADSATVDVTPFNVDGGLTASLTIQSRGNPGLVETVNFALITDGTDVLIVDGDGGLPYETFYRDAIPEPYPRGVWDLLLEPVTSGDLATFDFCFWLTGERTPALTVDEMGALSEFLDGGGRLFISGQDLGRDIGETAFYTDYLHASFISDSTGIFTLEGIAGEPISDGLTIQITGGDGAGNQARPSEIAPVGPGAYTSFYYQSTQRGAAVSSATYGPADTTRVVYFAFGFEGISTAIDRSTIAQRILEHLAGILVGIGGEELGGGAGPSLPATIALRQNYPNPFNPSTTIAFQTAEEAHADLAVYDLRGRRVRSLIDGSLPAGDHAMVWDGRDEQGSRVGSGIYLYRLLSNGAVTTRRMIVAK
ncbi:MAG: hypothetical protein A2Z06_02915 [Candidatus Glassbacteria bacterium RBG_16_58_8]|uniref:FlgD/Vpr Ig-like domain-containing protein n=1 Tax=Candidatus Glassbacteria bacterium RBG_16_58_8 TaxID=1817866 RepID=A0A1F5YCM2_9BACT|nr:MAG: hypothetical protein A2Z06_02915 [Candidatus Glassbacteria bacterium RBG_16_58_8]